MKEQKKTMKLETLSQTYDIPLWTIRKWASERRFPGIIKKGRSVYVDKGKFHDWFYKDEIKSPDEVEDVEGGSEIE